ncbi:30S ribosomal protein S27e [Candidatus Micrarchaeota archaeon]|nr:30S ribosomal protein S27e [Candidatus Micrarchaeota archaeon]MBU1166511.1 30S ribosomal protein S27e [Candidatus Micrarchaeota archaeon]MBU1887523.1 30S ribosomal protein S27e [Candidatus Micrarchaeota archaeon]
MSNYIKVKCKCGEEKIIFSHSTSVVKCSKCSEPIVHPSGGKAIVHAEEVEDLG